MNNRVLKTEVCIDNSYKDKNKNIIPTCSNTFSLDKFDKQ